MKYFFLIKSLYFVFSIYSSSIFLLSCHHSHSASFVTSKYNKNLSQFFSLRTLTNSMKKILLNYIYHQLLFRKMAIARENCDTRSNSIPSKPVAMLLTYVRIFHEFFIRCTGACARALTRKRRTYARETHGALLERAKLCRARLA